MATLSTGEGVSWGKVSNVTVALQLPDIQQTNGTIYAILSVMTKDGSILQLASGLVPNATTWGTYAMLIRNPTTYPQEYRSILNRPSPGISPGTKVSLSIYLAAGVWNFEARELGTNQTVHSALGENLSASLREGDQEVFALESYSSDSNVFANMGNLTLDSVLLNGQQVTAGWYFYSGGWNPSRSPLFIVGGGTPPYFVNIQNCDGNVACWNFRTQWTGVEEPSLTPVVMFAILGTVAAVIIISISAAILERRHRR